MNQIELTNLLSVHSYNYYTLDNPTITDNEYDKLYDELLDMERKSGVVYSNSPTLKVQGEVKSELIKIRHSRPMLSCDKTKDVLKAVSFMEKSTNGVVVSNKADGSSLILRYKGGELIQAITRGAGDEGEDVTHNARTFINLPLKIKLRDDIKYDEIIEVRGEAVINLDDFDAINSDGTYANPRNLVAGSLRLLDSKISAARRMRFYAFELVNDIYDTKEGDFRALKNMGFDVVNWQLIGSDYSSTANDDLILAIENWKINRNIPYLIDGLVLEYNDKRYGKSLGETSHHKNSQLAFKFEDDVYPSKFIGLELNTGRTGIVSLTAMFEPVEIEGTTVSRASVHNVDICEALKLGVGDTLNIYKANQIIPQIAQNLDQSNTYGIPNICPSCGKTLDIEKRVNTRVLVCNNKQCPAKLAQKIIHLCSKDCLDIDGFGENTINFLVDNNYLRNITDIFTMDFDQLSGTKGFGESSIQNMKDSVENARRTTLNRFIHALGIPNVGKTTSKLISEYYEYEVNNILINVLDCDFSKLLEIPTVGEIIINSLSEYFSSPFNAGELVDFINILTFIKPKAIKKSDEFSGKTFCITGSFSPAFGSRDAIKQAIEERGGKFVSSVSSKLDILFCGENAGSKLNKAKSFGTRIIEQPELGIILGI